MYIFTSGLKSEGVKMEIEEWGEERVERGRGDGDTR